jgi:O-antigen/teichoic acid export membrane protein
LSINKIKEFYNLGSANRAILNSFVIYSQRFLSALLSLITTPLILSALGVEDYGLYTLTIGFVGMLTFVNWSLSSATQRFIGVSLGEGDFKILKKVFSTSLAIHTVYGLIIFGILSIVATAFIKDIFNISYEKYETARYLIIIVSGITLVTIMSSPVTGVLRANENFFQIAIVGLFESLSKLAIAFLIFYVIEEEQLLIFALLLLLVTIVSFFFRLTFLRKNCPFVKITYNYFDKIQLRTILSFISWSLLGALAIVSRNQAVQVILNLFFGVIKNAAYGITMQVNSALSILGQGIVGAISPQIMKSAGGDEKEKMIFLMRTMSKFALFSVSIVSIPLFFNTSALLNFWLTDVPEDTVIYTKLIIILGQVMLLSAGMNTVFNAIGKVKTYNIYISLILLFNIPLAFLFFNLGYPSYSIIIISIVLELISLQVRFLLLKKYINYDLKSLYQDMVLKTIVPLLVVYLLLSIFSLWEIKKIITVLGSFLISIIVLPLIVLKYSLERKHKEILMNLIPEKIKNKMFK